MNRVAQFSHPFRPPFRCWIFPSQISPLCVRVKGKIKMPIEMLKGLPFSVDTWNPKSNTKRHHFLTHAHKDHTQGICTYASYPIYCSHLTKTLVLQHFPQVTVFFVSDFDFRSISAIKCLKSTASSVPIFVNSFDLTQNLRKKRRKAFGFCDVE